MQKIAAIIEEKIRPTLKAHQGDMELVEITTDGIVKIRLIGACATCPGAQQTVSEIIEVAVKEACPHIKGVVATSVVSDELIQQALHILRKGKN